MSNSPGASILSVRLTPHERALLDAAAEQTRSATSEFVRRMALEAAETELLNRSTVVIPAEDWEAFEAWAIQPAEKIPELAKLFARTPTWRE